jgi:phytoene dehydrogenase-like protein
MKRVVVIGSGLGGLSAAAFLAKNGFQVDVFERHATTGGYATSFVRNGFEFDVSLHELSGIGPEDNRGPCYRLLEACDVVQRVEFLPIKDFYSSIFPDFKTTIPFGWEAGEKAYCELFPNERKGVSRLIRFIRKIFKEVQMLQEEVGILDLITLPLRGAHLIRSAGLTVSQAINRELSDPKLKALFCNVWGYYGLPPSKLSFMVLALGNSSFLEYGPYYIKGTSQALSNAFVAVIEENGGRVHLRNGIKRIRVSGQKVTGVLTEKGDELTADFIVSNANPMHCCYDLIGLQNVPHKYLKSLGEGHIAISSFNVYMGLDCPSESLGLKHHDMFVNDSYDLEAHYQAMFRIGKQPYYVVTTYSVTDPESSPPGTTVVVLTGLQDYEAWSRIPPDEYVNTKNRMAELMIESANRYVPGLKDHIAVMEVATPLTNMRYTGNPGGSFLGFNYDLTGMSFLRLSNRGPLEGLYFANAWVRLGGGFETCITSGFLAYNEILKDLKRNPCL